MVTGRQLAAEAEKLPPQSIPYVSGGSTLNGMDCQGLVEYCLHALGDRREWKGSNAMWRSLLWRGTTEEAKAAFGEIPRGALLFIVLEDGGEVARGYHDGEGNASHVGIYTGTGDGAVHASSSRGCVVTSVFRGKTIPHGGWNRVGLLGEIDYALAGASEEAKMETRVVWSENGGKVRMRTAPSLKADCREKLEVGTEVSVLEDLGEWCRIQAGGKSGYMMSAYLKGKSVSPEDEDTHPLAQRLTALEERVRALEGGN